MTNTKHTAEPWEVGGSYQTRINANGRCIAEILARKSYDEDRNNAARIAQCVNACAGISDPVAALKLAREALQEAFSDADFCSHGATAGGSEERRHVERAVKYMRALAALNGEA